MSLPGLQLSAPAIETTPSIHVLKSGAEWRFEVAFTNKVEVKVLSGSAELFGTELAPTQPYTFTGTKAAIYTWHGCCLEVTGECQVEYVAEETPMVSYVNTHFALERARQESVAHHREGPRVMVVGPDNAGKTSLVKILTGYAVKAARQPLVINLDSREGLMSLPGSLTATVFSTLVDVEEGWGSSPTSGPSPVPVKLPLVYYYGLPSPEDNSKMFKSITTRIAVSATSRLADDPATKVAGCLIDTPGVISQGKGGYDIIQHLVSEFSVNVLLVLGSERLYSDMLRRFGGTKTSTDESITVLKLSKSGGCVDRDEAYMKQARQAQVREYFFGDAKRTLSPHTQQVDFSQVHILKIREANALHASLLPGGHDDEEEEEKGEDGPGARIFEELAPSPILQNGIMALMRAELHDSHASIRDASVLGFVYVADVDDQRKKLRLLAPVAGRLPACPMVWGSWPEPSLNLVG
ncbi:MAG: Cleavage polyadenylation factor subunit clp1 [Thelocarpon superellum]|nr:MAG: Cleavage polyadenylation factor subunit clp1 [Thelocarpon superellum]